MTRKFLFLTCTAAMMALTATSALAATPAVGFTVQREEVHVRFIDNDRVVTRTWYDSHQRNLPLGFRLNDRLAPDVELRFQEGFVFDRELRRQVYPVPSDLLRLLARAPRGYRYVVFGGHIVLIDGGYRVYDIIHVGHER